MTYHRKNVLSALAIGALLALLLFLVFPGLVRGESPCPGVPLGYMSPEGMMGTGWEVRELQQDQTYGLYWFFLKNRNPAASVLYGNLVMATGVDWPVFYNYLENGSLRFLRLLGDRSKYIVDPDVHADDYNAVTRYYQQFLGVFVAPRTGV